MLRFLSYVISALLVCTVNLLSDTLLSNPRVLHRILADTIAHGLTGGICCFMFTIFNPDHSIRSKCILSIVALSISMAIDIDHFLAAGSLDLKAATSLENRPFLHCSTVAIGLVITCCLIEATYRRSVANVQWTWVLFWALFTHQLRDGQRRGLWFCPFMINTNPISRVVFFVIISIGPAILYFVTKCSCGRVGNSNVALV